MEHVEKLKDGAEVLIRSMRDDDIGKSLAFFQSLPEEDRAYLRVDVTKREVIEQRIQQMKAGTVKRIVAVVGGEIVADGALEMDERTWKKHTGELRLIVSRTFQRQGLGMFMARDIYHLASSGKVEELIAKVMRPQMGARKILRRLGFTDQAMLPDYVRDIHGNIQDLVLMRCNLKALWDELEDYFTASDFMRTR